MIIITSIWAYNLYRKYWYNYGRDESIKIPIRPVHSQVIQLLFYDLSTSYLYSQNDIASCVEGIH